jgi:hypothetical protein
VDERYGQDIKRVLSKFTNSHYSTKISDFFPKTEFSGQKRCSTSLIVLSLPLPNLESFLKKDNIGITVICT